MTVFTAKWPTQVGTEDGLFLMKSHGIYEIETAGLFHVNP